MRAENKEKKKLVVTKKDLYTNDENSPLYDFNRMTEVDVYQYRIRKYLYEEEKISPKGFLFNDDILTLPGIAKKNRKGEILIDGYIITLLNRFLLAQKIFNSGNELLAFLIDFDTPLYDKIQNALLDSSNNEDIFSKGEIKDEVNKAFHRLTATILDTRIVGYVQSKKELIKFFE